MTSANETSAVEPHEPLLMAVDRNVPEAIRKQAQKFVRTKQ